MDNHYVTLPAKPGGNLSQDTMAVDSGIASHASPVNPITLGAGFPADSSSWFSLLPSFFLLQKALVLNETNLQTCPRLKASNYENVHLWVSLPSSNQKYSNICKREFIFT